MWIMTTSGFYSAVASDENTTDVVVRARHRDDLANLNKALTELDHLPGTVLAYQSSDYPWRVVISKDTWAAYLANEAQHIDYRNFKNEVTRKQGHPRHDIYSKVWGVLLGLEKLPGALKDHGKVVKRTPQRASRWASAGSKPLGRRDLTDAEYEAYREHHLFDDPDAPLDMLDDPTSPFYIGRSL